MHRSVMEWAAAKVAEHDLAHASVLEVGSYDVNGSVRALFDGPYVGVDMRPGPGVDLICSAHDLDTNGPAGLVDVVVSTEMLEHDDRPWVSVAQMAGRLRDGGLLLLTCRGYDERGCFPLHDYPADLWRFSVEGVRALFEACGLDPVEVVSDPEAPGVFALGRRP